MPQQAGLIHVGRRVLEGSLTAVRAVEICLERIEGLDAELKSFVRLRADDALAEAAALDDSEHRGPLHGIPFAAKDVFDTADLPTEYNSPYYRGHRPRCDAAAIALLRQAGGVLLGKLSTVEFAGVGAVPDTRNPHDVSRTPGGSSAGSGAAVGAGLVPLATATQTGGSTIRPAAFCGAAGYKPTWGSISFEGVKPLPRPWIPSASSPRTATCCNALQLPVVSANQRSNPRSVRCASAFT